jgi:hypothetical protein
VGRRNALKVLSLSFLRFRPLARPRFASLVRIVCTRDERKGDEHRMINFDRMTALAQAAETRTATLVPKDAPCNDFAAPGIEQHCGRSSAPGGAG